MFTGHVSVVEQPKWQELKWSRWGFGLINFNTIQTQAVVCWSTQGSVGSAVMGARPLWLTHTGRDFSLFPHLLEGYFKCIFKNFPVLIPSRRTERCTIQERRLTGIFLRWWLFQALLFNISYLTCWQLKTNKKNTLGIDPYLRNKDAAASTVSTQLLFIRKWLVEVCFWMLLEISVMVRMFRVVKVISLY